ncbi:hypothetical protein PIB30_035831 [Stylosanthes scabra]|uniref:Uncharacterized protein n=1 Tax=Stylosanthes scabra TaxID=79078 RepID=A0ABU6YFN2_9FABA|nr:hypothetical protein [Stylosanthes scabra]
MPFLSFSSKKKNESQRLEIFHSLPSRKRLQACNPNSSLSPSLLHHCRHSITAASPSPSSPRASSSSAPFIDVVPSSPRNVAVVPVLSVVASSPSCRSLHTVEKIKR